MPVFASVAYDLLINLIGGVVSAAIVLWVTERWRARAALRWQLIRLRNVLHDLETDTSEEFLRKSEIESDQISARFVELPTKDEKWGVWSSHCLEIFYALFDVSEKWALEGKLRESLFKRPREIDLAHFNEVDPLFIKAKEHPHLGVIECISVTNNLISAARRVGERMRRLADNARSAERNPKPQTKYQFSSACEEDELARVHHRIQLHRQHIERLIPGQVSAAE